MCLIGLIGLIGPIGPIRPIRPMMTFRNTESRTVLEPRFQQAAEEPISFPACSTLRAVRRFVTMAQDKLPIPEKGAAPFANTRWSVVLAAGGTETPVAREALGTLCEIYWYPVFSFLRRKGHDFEEAQDLTQGFFTRLLEKRDIRPAGPERGRFRSYLFAAVQHYVSNQHKQERAEKRGGKQVFLPLDFNTAEERYRTEPADHRTPEQAYERRWALALLSRVMNQLREEYVARGHGELFDLVQFTISGSGEELPYHEIAKRLEMSEGMLRVAIHRLKQKYRALLRQAVADIVSSPEEIREEIQFLLSALQT